MTTFEKRKDAYESKFARDEELRFKSMARRNKLLGLWAAEKLGKSGDAADAYAREVIRSDMQEAGDEDVFRKLRGDFDAAGVDQSDHQIRRTMEEKLAEAVAQIEAGELRRPLMADTSFAARLRAGESLYTAWSAIPEPLVSEFLGRSAFDAVTLDMQHGCHSTESVLRSIAAIKLAGKPAVVRIPVGRFDMASRSLDFGAAAVIAPMVNSLADARAFAASMKFPPVGERSWGPTRLLALHGIPDAQTYLASANRDTLAIAMIETRAAEAILDDILAVDGIDGVFVGPSDFSIAFSNGARIDPANEEMLAVAGSIATRAEQAGKIPCAYAASEAAAKRTRALGFRLIALGSDFGYLTAGANAIVEAARA